MCPVIAEMIKRDCVMLDKQDAIDAINAEGMNGQEAVATAIHHGALTVERGDKVSFGVPSFHNHMRQTRG